MGDEQAREAGRTTPPYIAFQSLKTLCATFKEHGIPGRIDRSVLGNFSGAVGGQIMTALKFLSLTDGDNHPTTVLHDLVDAHGTDEWASTLGVVIEAAYAPIFELDLKAASPGQFNEKFRGTYPSKDDTLRKCQGFFINAVRDANIPVSAYLMKNKKPRSGPTKRKPKVSASPKSNDDFTPPSGPATRQDGKPQDEVAKNPPDMASQLLAKFPTFDPNWPDEIKAKWFEGYERLLAMGSK